MSLPYKFKFKTIAENSITYTATVKEGALYYEWNGGSAYWDLIDAERLTTFGTWIITEVIQYKEDIMEQTVAELLSKAEEMKQLIEQAKKEETWPVNGDSYWYVEVSGSVYHDVWQVHLTDMERQKLGNVYRTREDAELYVQKRLVQVELETLSKKAWKESGEQFEWNGDGAQSYYHLYYDYVDGCFSVGANVYTRCIGQVFFPTEKSAKEVITTIGEERLKVLLK